MNDINIISDIIIPILASFIGGILTLGGVIITIKEMIDKWGLFSFIFRNDIIFLFWVDGFVFLDNKKPLNLEFRGFLNFFRYF